MARAGKRGAYETTYGREEGLCARAKLRWTGGVSSSSAKSHAQRDMDNPRAVLKLTMELQLTSDITRLG